MIIKFFKVIVIFYSINLLGQEIITLPYDNTGLDYQGPEVEKKGYLTDKNNFQNISIPTIQVFLPRGNLNTKTAMIICPGGGMRANAIHHEGFDVAKAQSKKS